MDIIVIVLSSMTILLGLASLITGKVYTWGSLASKYTDESLRKYARPSGLMNILIGSGVLVFHLLNDNSFTAGAVIMLVCLVAALVIGIMNRKVLVKK